MNRATFVDRFFDASFISFWEGVLGATPSQRGAIRISDEPNVLWRIYWRDCCLTGLFIRETLDR